MAAKGFTKSEANPDVFVVYHFAFDKQKDISTYSSGYGGGYGPYGWGYGGGWARRHDDDAGTRHPDRHAGGRYGRRQEGPARVARHGVKEVKTQASPEKRDKSINEAMKKIFKNYPPKQKT